MILRYFANILSFLPLLYIFLIIPFFILSNFDIVPNYFPLPYIIGLLLSGVMSQILKLVFYPLFPEAKRPKGACGCDFLSSKGLVEGNPGFPSGHMTLTAYFGIYNILCLLENLNNDIEINPYKNISNNEINSNISYIENITITTPTRIYALIFFNLLLILFMGWARHYKKCHNLIQIIGGTILGSIVALFFFSFLRT